MIKIEQKEDCCGCGACNEKCPTKCISLSPDDQGFLYPLVNLDKCINCGLCEKVCPVINVKEAKKPLQVIGATNKDKASILTSSSGGVFIAIATRFIDDGGVVFGAKFNEDWSVEHSYATTIDGLKKFQRSKYVQSRIGTSFSEVEKFLKSGRRVLFSGTPCQISGLKNFLRKDWGELLITIEVICHGVPSPLIWNAYLMDRYKTEIKKIDDISFRDKKINWEKFGLTVSIITQESKRKHYFEGKDANIYLQGFLRDYYLRPSCFKCPSKSLRSESDLTIGDFWHIKEHHPQYYDKMGTSLVLINSVNGQILINQSNLTIFHTSYETALKCVPSIERCAVKPVESDVFWENYSKHGIQALKSLINKNTSLNQRIKMAIKNILGEDIISWINRIRK